MFFIEIDLAWLIKIDMAILHNPYIKKFEKKFFEVYPMRQGYILISVLDYMKRKLRNINS
ncbi:MAG: hypothetical protein B6U87_01680 [Candidatus Aenigmarchaeota archaeon ex4484_52]|nr:MAG: hypothetical protein B6U87_01680 [Candidatus Aenigmarchaeota archaeon ex4484_52]